MRFILRDGDVWEQLELVIKEKEVDLVVVGTHGAGLGKLLLGAVALKVDLIIFGLSGGNSRNVPPALGHRF